MSDLLVAYIARSGQRSIDVFTEHREIVVSARVGKETPDQLELFSE